ncbi:MAG: hypothetical protein Q9178_006607 [Gyalolechia marmorata]
MASPPPIRSKSCHGTSNRKKRWNVLDNTTAHARQPPHKKRRKAQTASSQRATLASYSTDTNPKVTLSRSLSLKLGPSARPEQRYQPCREVKVMPSIEHRIDPQNPRHSAHPWDDPIVQNLNEDDSSNLCSQRNNSHGVPDNHSPTPSDPTFLPSPTASLSISDQCPSGRLRRCPIRKQRDGNYDNTTPRVRHQPGDIASVDDQMASMAKVERELTAAVELASSCLASAQAPNRDEDLLDGNQSDFWAAEGLSLASLRRQVTDYQLHHQLQFTQMRELLMEYFVLQTDRQTVTQVQAQRYRADWLRKAKTVLGEPHSMTNPGVGGPLTPVVDRYNDKRNENYSTTRSSAIRSQSKSFTDVASPRAMDNSLGIHCRDGQLFGPNRGDMRASSARNSTHEEDIFCVPETPSPFQQPRSRTNATHIGRPLTTSSSHMKKMPHELDRTWSQAHTSQSFNPVGKTPEAPSDSFNQRRSTDDSPGHWDSTRRGRRRRSSTIIPCRGNEVFQSKEFVGTNRDGEPRSPLFLSPAMQPTTGSLPPDRRSVGLNVEPANALRHRATSRGEQSTNIDDVEDLERMHSELAKQGQMLEKTLLKANLGEVKAAEFKSKEIHDHPKGRQQRRQRPGFDGVQMHLGERDPSELPDMESLFAEARPQNNRNVRHVSTTVEVQTGDLRSTYDSKAAGQTNSKLTERAVPELPHPKPTTNMTTSVAEQSKSSPFSKATEVQEVKSKSSHHKAVVSITPQDIIAPPHFQMPTDEHAVRQGTTGTNSNLPSFEKNHCQNQKTLTERVLSYPNNIAVQPLSNRTRHRQFERSLPSRAREIETGSSGVYAQRCKCSCLPDYFREPQSLRPSLQTWPAGEPEFLAHCEQIVDCLAHPDITRSTCREILDNERSYGGVHNTDELQNPGKPQGISQPQQQKAHTDDNALEVFTDNGFHSGPERLTNSPVTSETLLERTNLSDYSTVLSEVSYGERPQFRVPPCFLSTSPRPTRDFTVSQGEKKVKGSNSKSRKSTAKPHTSKDATGLPTPANSSSPTRTELEQSLQLTDNSQASPSPQPSSLTLQHCRTPKPSVVDKSNTEALAAQTSNLVKSKHSKGASKSSRKRLKAVVIENYSSSTVEGSGADERNQDTKLDPGSSLTGRLTPDRGSPERRANNIHRRYATEPPNPIAPMSPATAVREATRNLRQRPLLAISGPTLNQQRIDARHSSKRKRPLWEQTPPPTPKHKRKKRYIPVVERKRLRPERPANVALDQRLADEELIQIGRHPKTYIRHISAPYAFSYTGRLFEEYRRLTKLKDEDGNPLWDEALTKRLVGRNWKQKK